MVLRLAIQFASRTLLVRNPAGKGCCSYGIRHPRLMVVSANVLQALGPYRHVQLDFVEVSATLGYE